MNCIDLIKKKEEGVEQNKILRSLSIIFSTLAVILIVAMIGSATFAPNLPARVASFTDFGVYGDDELIFTHSDIGVVNDRLNESKEFGWCLSTEKSTENRFNVNLTKGENMTRSSNAVSFSCSVWETGRLHTHPGIWTLPYPSKFDKEAFKRSNQRFHCVAAGHVNTVDEPIAMNCYQESERGIERVRIKVE